MSQTAITVTIKDLPKDPIEMLGFLNKRVATLQQLALAIDNGSLEAFQLKLELDDFVLTMDAIKKVLMPTAEKPDADAPKQEDWVDQVAEGKL